MPPRPTKPVVATDPMRAKNRKPPGSSAKASGLEITVFSKDGGVLTKTIKLGKDGEVIADGSACKMAEGEAERTAIADLHALAAVIEGLGSHQAIALGTIKSTTEMPRLACTTISLPSRIRLMTVQPPSSGMAVRS